MDLSPHTKGSIHGIRMCDDITKDVAAADAQIKGEPRHMSNDEKKSDARPVFRWLAGLSALAFLLTAAVAAFPGLFALDEEPNIWLAVFILWGAIMFGTVARTGSMPKGRKVQMKLYLAARKYASGQMSLEEYGSFTKKLLDEE